MHPSNYRSEAHTGEDGTNHRTASGTFSQSGRFTGAPPAHIAEAKTKYEEACADLRRYNFRAYTARAHHEWNRAGTLLAWLIRQDMQTQPITGISNAIGEVVYTQASILSAFHDYYTSLYKEPIPDRGGRYPQYASPKHHSPDNRRGTDVLRQSTHDS